MQEAELPENLPPPPGPTGDPGNARPEAQGNVRGDIFGCPDGLMLDARGVLWIQTDVHASQMNQGTV